MDSTLIEWVLHKSPTDYLMLNLCTLSTETLLLIPYKTGTGLQQGEKDSTAGHTVLAISAFCISGDKSILCECV